jgi:hypothetical protein
MALSSCLGSELNSSLRRFADAFLVIKPNESVALAVMNPGVLRELGALTVFFWLSRQI